MTEQPLVKRIFPNESYTSEEIYWIASENLLAVEDTPISDDIHILEVIECFHEREDYDQQCRLTSNDSEHETIAEFHSTDGQQTYKRV